MISRSISFFATCPFTQLYALRLIPVNPDKSSSFIVTPCFLRGERGDSVPSRAPRVMQTQPVLAGPYIGLEPHGAGGDVSMRIGTK